jgi:hypothetical protein
VDMDHDDAQHIDAAAAAAAAAAASPPSTIPSVPFCDVKLLASTVTALQQSNT